jgi:uncharacterized protein YhaN
MRFSELSLERYGRFQDCTLRFAARQPDLHVVYGENEAGKSTTLAAVSDLLFGFPRRSPYNFRFDYGLLRVGAVLEGASGSLVCRRRKGDAHSLVDGADRPMDDAPLRALLHGQERDAFRLGFSLNQARLREGGEAMVQAKNDLGQALFAAGSGLTHVAAALAALEAEAKQIWAKGASTRVYNVAKGQFDLAQRRLKELELKPRAWLDAQALLRRTEAVLAELEAKRATLSGERRRLERLRRIGPDVRRREAVLDELARHSSELWLSATADAATAAALAALEEAARDEAAATSLLNELDTRLAELTPDAAVLAAAEAIDALSARRGAEEKGTVDLARLRGELGEKRAREARLQAELGTRTPVPRLLVARLRELAGRHGANASALVETQGACAELQRQAEPLRAAVADAAVAEGLAELVAAVEAARALGEDIDARCVAAARALERLEGAREAKLTRLAPWRGEARALAALPVLDAAEVETSELALRRAREAAETAGAEVRLASEALEVLAAERRALAEGGQGVPAERVAEARAARDQRWAELRRHLLGDAPVADPHGAAAAFAQAVAEADQIADRRFALAEASGRLSALDDRARELSLAGRQAQVRAERAEAERMAAGERWGDRLAAAGLPGLEPAALRAWMEMRREALAADEEAGRAREALDLDRRRRAQAHARLASLLAADVATAPDEALGPILARAVRLRADGEAINRRFTERKAELRGLEDHLAERTRSQARLEADGATIRSDWARETEAAGLDLPIAGADARLAVLDELRTLADEAESLDRRISGIERDSRGFAEDVARTADGLGEPAEPDPARRLEGVRVRLAHARSIADARRELETTHRLRRDAVQAAAARARAARDSLAPRAAELGLDRIEDLPEALDASRQARRLREELATLERRIGEAGDHYPLADLAAAVLAEDPDTLATRLAGLESQGAALDVEVSAAADAAGSARQAFAAMESGPAAAEAAADAAIARAEMDAQAEAYVLKRAQAVALRWAVDRYRERRQNPLLARASNLFRTLTLGRYLDLRIDLEAPAPRLQGLCEDGASLVAVEDMSEGTRDQLFLALRLAAVEQAIAAGVKLPFLADDLFVNFDDDRARAGLQVLAELARSTQVLVFTHHAHLVQIARDVAEIAPVSECCL